MPQNAHIFTPKDDSLQEKINAYKNVLKAYRNVELSLKRVKEKGKDDTLGSIEEIKQAYNITQTSLQKAISSFTPPELEQAKEKKLLTTDELKETRVQRRKAKMSDFRQSQKSHKKDGHSFKR